METCVIIDYGSGNLRSAAKAFERAAQEEEIAVRIEVTSSADAILTADRIVLPGVGAFADCRHGLDAVADLVPALNRRVIEEGRPFLGICVGMQLMAERGLEFRVTEGLGWIAGDVVAIPVDGGEDAPFRRVPHMGWNDLQVYHPDHPVLRRIRSGDHAYFVHSFKFVTSNPADCLASVDYGGPIMAIIGRDNLIGTQFHPEKSQETGLRLIADFLRWHP